MRSRWVLTLAALVCGTASVHAQTIEDAVMMPKQALCTGFMYAHDGWEQYWEGTLKRVNGNMG